MKFKLINLFCCISITLCLSLKLYAQSQLKEIDNIKLIVSASQMEMVLETNAKVILDDIENSINPSIGVGCPGNITDIEGNIYHVVEIGNQCWMKENLKTSRFSDGSLIPNVTEDTDWIKLNSPAWCNYNNIDSNDIKFGKLYNWYTVADSRNVCPAGWHIPTEVEWTILTDYLGGKMFAGGKMKTTNGWLERSEGTTNGSGFSGFPGGYRYHIYGDFYDLDKGGGWWSSTEISISNAVNLNLVFGSSDAGFYNSYKYYGYSIRCLKN